MEYDKKILVIMSICVMLGTLFLIFGIITSEIEIRKETYDNINN